MEPFSIASLIGSCGSIVAHAFKLGDSLVTLVQKYESVEQDAQDLSAHVLAVDIVVNNIQCWLKETPSFDSEDNAELRSKVGRVLGRCNHILSRINGTVSTILTESGSITFRGRTKYVWNRDSLKSDSDMLAKLVQPLGTILQGLQLPTRNDQLSALEDAENGSIIGQAEDASSSLLCLQDADSRSYRGTWYSESSSKLSLLFSLLDRQLADTAVYRKVMQSLKREKNWKQRAAKSTLHTIGGINPIVGSAPGHTLRGHEFISVDPLENHTLTVPLAVNGSATLLLHLACYGGRYADAETLLIDGADINVYNSLQETALHALLVNCTIDTSHAQDLLSLVRKSLEKGVDIEARDRYARRPLDRIRQILHSHEEIVDRAYSDAFDILLERQSLSSRKLKQILFQYMVFAQIATLLLDHHIRTQSKSKAKYAQQPFWNVRAEFFRRVSLCLNNSDAVVATRQQELTTELFRSLFDNIFRREDFGVWDLSQTCKDLLSDCRQKTQDSLIF